MCASLAFTCLRTRMNSINQFMSGVGLDSHNSLTNLLENDDDEFNTIKMSPYYADVDTCIASDLHRNAAFNYVSLNCGGLNVKYDYVKLFIEKFSAIDHPIQAMALQEKCFSNETDLALYQIPGYQLISIGHHASIKGGLVIYLHDSWNFKIVHSNKNSQIWESLIIEISNPCNGSAPTIILGNIYRPPKSGRNELDTFNTEFNQVLLDLQSNTHMVYGAGDFNINLLAVNDTQFNSDYFDSILAAGYLPTITLPTRLSQNSTLIDNIFTNNLKDFTAVVLGDHISDHQAIIVSADTELPRRPEKYVTIRSKDEQSKIKFARL